MKKIAYTLLASAGALALAACGSSDSASEDAQADSVEMPADEAMTGTTEEPAADADAMSDAVDDATAAATEVADKTAEAADAAGKAAADVADAVAGDSAAH